MQVSDIAAGAKDEADTVILEVYARYAPYYAVYRTDDRVAVRFADAADLEKSQRSAIAKLSPLRGEINGLIDGWRHAANPRQKATARRFERRVADALVVALEDDVADAALLLQAVKADVMSERTSRGRFQYLEIAALAVAFALAFNGVCSAIWSHIAAASYSNIVRLLWMASAAGSWGAFFSVAIAMRNREVMTDLQPRDNASDAILRILIGAISAPILICLFVSKLVTFKIADADVAALSHPETFTDANWMQAFVLAFVAGFLERLIPDLLAKAIVKGAAPTPTSETMNGHKPPLGPRHRLRPTDDTALTAGAKSDGAEPAPAAISRGGPSPDPTPPVPPA